MSLQCGWLVTEALVMDAQGRKQQQHQCNKVSINNATTTKYTKIQSDSMLAMLAEVTELMAGLTCEWKDTVAHCCVRPCVSAGCSGFVLLKKRRRPRKRLTLGKYKKYSKVPPHSSNPTVNKKPFAFRQKRESLRRGPTVLWRTAASLGVSRIVVGRLGASLASTYAASRLDWNLLGSLLANKNLPFISPTIAMGFRIPRRAGSTLAVFVIGIVAILSSRGFMKDVEQVEGNHYQQQVLPERKKPRTKKIRKTTTYNASSLAPFHPNAHIVTVGVCGLLPYKSLPQPDPSILATAASA